ncbi:MAG: rhodanese-like domain-containing protein [Myxococcota bacterium]|nr:rhodanese-like domain-containing protein [Myxococcota bacterium]
MSRVQQISPRELVALRRTDNPPVCVDVRTGGEYEIASIENTLHIPMHEIADRLDELDPTQHVVVICHHGIRSMRVALYLEHCGFERLSNLAGGIEAWSIDVDAQVPRY